MTIGAAARADGKPRDNSKMRVALEWYRAMRTAHPVVVLGWLRNGVLVCVLAAALAYVWVATAAAGDIATAGRTPQAIQDIDNAMKAAKQANTAFKTEFGSEDPALIGFDTGFNTDLNEVSTDLTLAAENNAADQPGTDKLQFAQNQLLSFLSESEIAVSNYDAAIGGPLVAQSEAQYTSGLSSGLKAALNDLRAAEMTAFRRQRGAWPLDPGAFWLLMLAPVIVMAALTAATARVLAGHFRRRVDGRLRASLLATAATTIVVGVFNAADAAHLSANPWAGHPVTLAVALSMFALAAVLAYLAYRPRLAEYRFES